MLDHEYVDLERDDDEMADAMASYPGIKPKSPNYPPGCCFCLTDVELEKMGFDPQDMKQDGIIHMHALARITSVTHHDGGSRVECQMMAIKIESEDAEDEADESGEDHEY